MVLQLQPISLQSVCGNGQDNFVTGLPCTGTSRTGVSSARHVRHGAVLFQPTVHLWLDPRLDYFTKFVNLYPLPNQSAQTVAYCLFDDYVLFHGIPETLHKDQGRQFEAEVVQTLCSLLKIKKTHTTPYHPQSDGMVERINRTQLFSD